MVKWIEKKNNKIEIKSKEHNTCLSSPWKQIPLSSVPSAPSHPPNIIAVKKKRNINPPWERNTLTGQKKKLQKQLLKWSLTYKTLQPLFDTSGRRKVAYDFFGCGFDFSTNRFFRVLGVSSFMIFFQININ